MKKLLYLSILLTIAGAVALSSCGRNAKAVAELKKEISTLQKRCPLNYPDGTTLTSATYEDDMVVLNYINNGTTYTLNKLSHDEALLKEAYLYSTITNPDFKKCLSQLIEAESGFRITIKDKTVSKPVVIEYSIDELKQSRTQKKTNKELLDMQIKIANTMLPLPIDEATEMTGIKIDGSNLIYECKVNHKVADFNAAKQGKEQLKEYISQGLRNRINEAIRQVIRTNMGLAYKMYSDIDPSNNFTFEFTNKELRSLTGDYLVEE